jgi:type II secretory pathway pseudopilin PulG
MKSPHRQLLTSLTMNPPRHRSGFTVVELIATLILLGVVFTVSISILLAVTHSRRVAEQRQFAMQYAANLLEQAASRPWAELAPGPQPRTPIPPDLATVLPDLEQSIDVTDSPTEFHSRQISVTIRWKDRRGQSVAPMRLTGWAYPTELQP